MALIKLGRAAQITLPDDIREAAKLTEGDYLEAEVTKAGAILLDEARDALLSARLKNAYGHDASNVLAWLAELRDIGAVFR